MFDTLPLPDNRPLAQAPVQLATFQLDFAEERPLAPKDGIAWRDALRSRGYVAKRLVGVKQQSVTIQVSQRAAGQKLGPERNGWQCYFEDGASSAAIYATAVAVERANYSGYEHFKSDILHAFDAAVDLLAPQLRERVVLTYSNALSHEAAESVNFWRGKVRPEFLGLAQNVALTPDLGSILNISSWSRDEYSAEMRIAVQPDQVFDGAVAYVFQIEVSHQSIAPIDRDEIVSVVDELHSIASKLFAATVEPDYLEELRKS
jgi:uncharacterized protein (TIGR04255 family)